VLPNGRLVGGLGRRIRAERLTLFGVISLLIERAHSIVGVLQNHIDKSGLPTGGRPPKRPYSLLEEMQRGGLPFYRKAAKYSLTVVSAKTMLPHRE
jgi:hypothetical protein